MNRILINGIIGTNLAFTTVGLADVFNLGGGLTSLEMVLVGDEGNAGEGSGEGYTGPDPFAIPPFPRICGAVNYCYNIGKYEITTGQYTAFLNAVAKTDTNNLYMISMWSGYGGYNCKIQRTGTSGNYVYTVASDYANRPVTFILLGNTLRFCNWLTNGQPTGGQDASTTEDGSYTLTGITSSEQLLTVARNPGGRYFLPTEDEWYKAVYYDPAKPGGPGYWDYATRSDVLPGQDITFTLTYHPPQSTGAAKAVWLAPGGSITIAGAGIPADGVYKLAINYDNVSLGRTAEQDLRLMRVNANGSLSVIGTADSGNQPATGTLGDYGVNTAAKQVWANVGTLGTFTVGVPKEVVQVVKTTAAELACPGMTGILFGMMVLGFVGLNEKRTTH
jgi:hypothetical protein